MGTRTLRTEMLSSATIKKRKCENIKRGSEQNKINSRVSSSSVLVHVMYYKRYCTKFHCKTGVYVVVLVHQLICSYIQKSPPPQRSLFWLLGTLLGLIIKCPTWLLHHLNDHAWLPRLLVHLPGLLLIHLPGLLLVHLPR